MSMFELLQARPSQPSPFTAPSNSNDDDESKTLTCNDNHESKTEQHHQQCSSPPSVVTTTSPLGKRILKTYLNQRRILEEKEKEPTTASTEEGKTDWWHSSSSSSNAHHHLKSSLPSDFLRIPSRLAVRIRNESTGLLEWKSIRELEDGVLSCHKNVDGTIYTVVLTRDLSVGLGLTIREDDGCIFVHALIRGDGTRRQQLAYSDDDDDEKKKKKDLGPAEMAGLKPGDRILGLNGRPFLQWQVFENHVRIAQETPSCCQHGNEVNNNNNSKPISSTGILESVADCIKDCPDPIVLHLEQAPKGRRNSSSMSANCSSVSVEENGMVERRSRRSRRRRLGQRYDYSLHEEEWDGEDWKVGIHPLGFVLAEKKLIRDDKEELILITKLMRQFNERTRQWETTSRFCIDANEFTLVTNSTQPPPSSPLKRRISSSRSVIEMSHIVPSNEQMLQRSNSFTGGTSTPPRQPQRRHSSNHYRTPIRRRTNEFPGARLFRLRTQSQSPTGNSPPRKTTTRIYLASIRKALSIRIVNTFRSDDDRIAYTIWVHDLQDQQPKQHNRSSSSLSSFREWYAPVRYMDDFLDLRTSILQLCEPSPTIHSLISNLPFPSSLLLNWHGSTSLSTSMRRGIESDSGKEQRCLQLEHFLRFVSGMVYVEGLHPNTAEVAIHLQSFLGCDTISSSSDSLRHVDAVFREDHFLRSNLLSDQNHHFHRQSIHISTNSTSTNSTSSTTSTNSTTTSTTTTSTTTNDIINLSSSFPKSSIQRYIYRILLLPPLQELTRKFILTTKEKYDTFSVAEMKKLDRKSRTALKERATKDLDDVRTFFDRLQDLLFKGCLGDLEGLLESHEHDHQHDHQQDLFKYNDKQQDDHDENDVQIFFREAIREQVEIEVYVPLRSGISRQLVNGWRHDDMEMQFKMQALRTRPQSFFNIHSHHQSPSEWKSVSNILKDGVGRTTLPSNKLRAIVDAAKEITALYSLEHDPNASGSLYSSSSSSQIRTTTSLDEKEEHMITTTTTTTSTLGADNFLPIFIFCVVRANLERPCALCAMLRTLCDPSKRIGETGYYLASFEAAIEHIRELDLTASATAAAATAGEEDNDDDSCV